MLRCNGYEHSSGIGKVSALVKERRHRACALSVQPAALASDKIGVSKPGMGIAQCGTHATTSGGNSQRNIQLRRATHVTLGAHAIYEHTML